MERCDVEKVWVDPQLLEECPVPERLGERLRARGACMNASEQITGGSRGREVDVARHEARLPRLAAVRSALHHERVRLLHDPDDARNGSRDQLAEHDRAFRLDRGSVLPSEPRRLDAETR